jgi:hypothetical protein
VRTDVRSGINFDVYSSVILLFVMCEVTGSCIERVSLDACIVGIGMSIFRSTVILMYSF